MDRRRRVWRLAGIAALVGLVSLAGCTLLQPKAAVDFAASGVEGPVPFTVEFTPLVEGDVAHYHWDFGDGETSSDSSPVHVYRAAGTYDVFLTVTMVDGSTGAVKKSDLIEAKAVARKSGLLSMLYWLNTSTGTIHRGDRAGYSSETIVEYIYNGGDLDVGGGYVYWTADDSVRRANYDGTGKETIATNQSGLSSVTVDGVARKIYWACRPNDALFGSTGWDGCLKRANLDGSGRSTLEIYDTGTLPFAWWIRSDAGSGRLYRYFDDDNIVRPVRLTPTGLWDGRIQWLDFPTPTTHTVHRVKGSMNGIKALALDVGYGPALYVYWITGQSIKRCRVDGSDTTTILSDLNSPRGVAVDVAEGKMYWSDAQGIHRANLDGAEAELIYPGVRADVLVIQQ